MTCNWRGRKFWCYKWTTFFPSHFVRVFLTFFQHWFDWQLVTHLLSLLFKTMMFEKWMLVFKDPLFKSLITTFQNQGNVHFFTCPFHSLRKQNKIFVVIQVKMRESDSWESLSLENFCEAKKWSSQVCEQKSFSIWSFLHQISLQHSIHKLLIIMLRFKGLKECPLFNQLFLVFNRKDFTWTTTVHTVWLSFSPPL